MASPWGKIEQVKAENFQDIMSEEYARGVQGKEIKKYSDSMRKKLEDSISLAEIAAEDTKDAVTAVEKTVQTTIMQDDAGASGFACDPDEEIARKLQAKFDEVETRKLPLENGGLEIPLKTKEECQEEKKDTSPEDIMKVIKEDPMMAAGTVLTDYVDSDELIAHVLQAQFDLEYNEELKRLERHKNKQSKISVSFKNYERHFDDDMEEEEEEYYAEDADNSKRDWDRFETNKKKLDAIPKCGFKVGDEGEMVTKHDPDLCGVQNACRVMSFPPEFPTGDAGGFEMKLPNAVFNQLKTYSKKVKKNKMHDRKENMATAEMGVDGKTRLMLYKLINNRMFEQVNGVISTGKEAVILHADSDPTYEGEQPLPRECAIKIFKTTLNEFKQRDRYIKDDYRFKDRFSKQNNRVVINMWAEKEMHNMTRLKKAGINCPNMLLLKKHMLVMSFIGENHNPAPKLKDARLTDAEWSVAYDETIDMMYKMYNVAQLVHADLSEYNILWYEGKCWFIDVAQSVEPRHPSALEYLMRDCDNIITFFAKRGLPNIMTKDELFEHITSLNAQEHNTALLERLQSRGPTVKQATLPNPEEVPQEFQPLAYPFDLAWEKSEKDRVQLVGTKKQDENVGLANILNSEGLKQIDISTSIVFNSTIQLLIKALERNMLLAGKVVKAFGLWVNK